MWGLQYRIARQFQSLQAVFGEQRFQSDRVLFWDEFWDAGNERRLYELDGHDHGPYDWLRYECFKQHDGVRYWILGPRISIR